MDIDKLYDLYLNHPEICTDSRKILQGCLFFALKGDSFDGNLFAEKALTDGAAYAIIDRPEMAMGNKYIVVDDVLLTLQHLANHRRKKLNIPVIAITGSNGKTTTKELCREVLLKKYKVKATTGNLNNHIGVPITLLTTPIDTEILIVEMGANHQGEINALCHIAEPNYVMITNIGKAHLEGFGGVEGIKKGKSEMYRYAASHHGKIFVNTDDDILMSLLPPVVEKISYSADELVNITVEVPYLEFDYLDNNVSTMLYGAYNRSNIAFAIAAGQFFGVDTLDICAAISSYIPENNRSQIDRSGPNIIIKDAYNANPSSMKESIESFAKIKAEDKVLILGDMLELGEYADHEHQIIIDLTKRLEFKNVIFIGQNFDAVQDKNHGVYFTDIHAAKKYFEDQHFSNTTILLKGSRGIAVEKIIS
jgi:UDP-N-acetylmuramoyl-tripeptide--D-alanyl-D-alanine ligase